MPNGPAAAWSWMRELPNTRIRSGKPVKTIRPKVYIAVGISGAIQHLAGMKESEKIIAIDHNPKAPIFHFADFGIVGEYQDILPELIERGKGRIYFWDRAEEELIS